MTYACPFCPICATRSGELLDHLEARRLWGGHQITRARALRIVERISRESSAKKRSVPSVSSVGLARAKPRARVA
jgi:hypothetical protein